MEKLENWENSSENFFSEIAELSAIAIDRERSWKSRFWKVLEMQTDFWTMHQQRSSIYRLISHSLYFNFLNPIYSTSNNHQKTPNDHSYNDSKLYHNRFQLNDDAECLYTM